MTSTKFRIQSYRSELRFLSLFIRKRCSFSKPRPRKQSLTYSIAFQSLPSWFQTKPVDMIINFEVSNTPLKACRNWQFFRQPSCISCTTNKQRFSESNPGEKAFGAAFDVFSTIQLNPCVPSNSIQSNVVPLI